MMTTEHGRQFVEGQRQDWNRARAPGDNVLDHEFLAERSYESAEQYYTSLMEIAAPIQNLMAPLSEKQRQEVKRLILEGALQYRRAERISFPVAVRVVVGRKPS